MADLQVDIYNREYSPVEMMDKLPSDLRISERAFWDAVGDALGAEFAEHHQQRFDEREEFQNYASFREGFRLGVSLMMESR